MSFLQRQQSSQIEEAIKTLKDFHENQKKEAENAALPPGSRQHDENVVGDDQTEGGEDFYRRSRMNYKEHAKKYFGLATRTWKMLWLLCKHCAPTIITGEGGTILEQLLHTSLDAQLHTLVGPDMRNIKATPAEYTELSFEPKEIVRQIAEIFLFLIDAGRDEVVRVVAKDERYYSPATFGKAVSFLRKYGLMQGDDLPKFDAFVKELAEKVTDQRAAFTAVDIPENFLCEIMADIMSDPVMLPQSRKVVDRTSAWRVIAGTDRDPYANTPVTMEQLIPQTELKQEIHRFAKTNGITLEGGNMFD